MKKRTVLLFFFIMHVSPLSAQERVELFGYYESQMMGTKIKRDFNQLFTNKARIDIKSGISEKITVAANYDYITYHGKTTWNVLDFLSSNINFMIPEEMKPFYVIPFSDQNFLDNAYVKMAFDKFDLTAGKQQISLGTGYVWNPTDVFNIKDVLDPTYEQPGHNAVRLDIPVKSAYTITALYSPEYTWNTSAKLLQFKGRISHFDYSLIAIEKLWRFHDYTGFDPVIENFTELPEKRQLIGASTAGELLGLGTWAEYGYNDMEFSKDFYELVVGADYTFDFQTYVMAEFYRNTLGKTDYRQYDINDWMRLFATEQKAISRDQLYLYGRHPVTDFLDLGSSFIYSISDKSMAWIPTLTYSFSENVEIMAYLNINFGGEGRAYAKKTGDGGIARVRVYF